MWCQVQNGLGVLIEIFKEEVPRYIFASLPPGNEFGANRSLIAEKLKHITGPAPLYKAYDKMLAIPKNAFHAIEGRHGSWQLDSEFAQMLDDHERFDWKYLLE